MTDMESKIFMMHRNTLMALAYRMLGTITEAEDVVQDVYLQWAAANGREIKNPRAWLMKVCTNRAIDNLRKASKKREVYVGTWLPEPAPNALISWEEPVSSSENPIEQLHIKESLTISYLVLLERLTPVERAIYLLHDIFQFKHKEIAPLIEKTEATCRKILQRAKEKISHKQHTFDSANAPNLEVISQFFESAKEGNIVALKEQLAPDAEFWSDGGGKVPAVPYVMNDNNKIATFFGRVFGNPRTLNMPYKAEFTWINNRPGLILSIQDQSEIWKMETVFIFELQNNSIARIYAMRNPDKLTRCISPSV